MGLYRRTPQSTYAFPPAKHAQEIPVCFLDERVPELSESQVIPNMIEAWNIWGKNVLAAGDCSFSVVYLDLRASMGLAEASRHVDCISVTQKPPAVTPARC